MSDQLTTERLREIAEIPKQGYTVSYDYNEVLAIAAELLAKREECEAVGRHRDQLLDLARLDNEAAREAVLLGRENKFRFGAMTTRDAIAEVAQQRDAARAEVANASRSIRSAFLGGDIGDTLQERVDFLKGFAREQEASRGELIDQLQAARAEAEKLRAYIGEILRGVAWDEVIKERDEARAEAEKLRRELISTGLRAGCLGAERDEARAETEKLRADLQAMTVEAMRAGEEANKLRAEALAYQQDYIDLRMAGIVQGCESLAAAVVRLHGELGVRMLPMHLRRPVGWFRFMGVTFHPVDGTPEQRERATQLLADKLDADRLHG